jgi:hypothetical protein
MMTQFSILIYIVCNSIEDNSSDSLMISPYPPPFFFLAIP